MQLSIKTSKGKYKYKFVPLFAGVKRINKDIAARNLIDFKAIMDSHGIVFCLAYGTLLGAVREKDFIAHDEDIDLIITGEYSQKLFDALCDFRKSGFEVCRYDRRGVISFMREGEYIDIYIFNPYQSKLLRCGREIIPAKYFKDITPLEFKGIMYNAPTDYAEFLTYYYGDNWGTPIQQFQYEQPKWKKAINLALQYFKELLPDSLFFALVDIQDKKVRADFLGRIASMELDK